MLCYFLVTEQESNQRTQPKGASAPIAFDVVWLPLAIICILIRCAKHHPFGNPRRIAGGADKQFRFCSVLPIGAKIGTFLCRSGSKLRCIALTKCGRGILKGVDLARGSATYNAPLSRLLFVLFLPKQEKNIFFTLYMQEKRGNGRIRSLFDCLLTHM